MEYLHTSFPFDPWQRAQGVRRDISMSDLICTEASKHMASQAVKEPHGH